LNKATHSVSSMFTDLLLDWSTGSTLQHNGDPKKHDFTVNYWQPKQHYSVVETPRYQNLAH